MLPGFELIAIVHATQIIVIPLVSTENWFAMLIGDEFLFQLQDEDSGRQDPNDIVKLLEFVLAQLIPAESE